MSKNKLILLDFPCGYKIGIDLKFWTVGPNFKGIKDIPDGPHFVYYGAEEGNWSSAFFVYLSDNEIIVKRWSPNEEDFIDYHPTDTDKVLYKENEEEISRYLGVYFMENHMDWWAISNYISRDLLYVLTPDCGRILSTTQFVSPGASNTADRQNRQVKLDKDGLEELEIDVATKIKFLEIPKYLYPEGCTSRTTFMLDKSYTLDSMLQFRDITKDDPKALLGELQFAFIVYNLIFSLAGLEQWLTIIDLFSSCKTAIVTQSDLYCCLISVLFHQLKLTEEDFSDITTFNNRFYLSMKRLFETLCDAENITDDLKLRAKGFRETIEKKYEWNFDEELDDEQPVIVEVNDSN